MERLPANDANQREWMEIRVAPLNRSVIPVDAQDCNSNIRDDSRHSRAVFFRRLAANRQRLGASSWHSGRCR